MSAIEEKTLLKNIICQNCNLEYTNDEECHSYSCYELRERVFRSLDLLEKQEQGLIIELHVPV